MDYPTITTAQYAKFIIRRSTQSFTRDPLLGIGPTGIGKTAIPEQLAKEINEDLKRTTFKSAPEPMRQIYLKYAGNEEAAQKIWDNRENKFFYHCIHFTQHENTDVSGIPFPDHESKQAIFYPTELIPQEERDPYWIGIFQLDELPAADEMTQAALHSLIQERRVGTRHKLPLGVFLMGTGNRVQDNNTSNVLLATISSRFTKFFIKPDIETWAAYAVSYGTPDVFIEFLLGDERGKMHFHTYSQKEYDEKGHEAAFVCPRSWIHATNILADYYGKKEGKVIPPEDFLSNRDVFDELASALTIPTLINLKTFVEKRDALNWVKDILANKETTIPWDNKAYIQMGAVMLALRANDENSKSIVKHFVNNPNLPRETLCMFAMLLFSRKDFFATGNMDFMSSVPKLMIKAEEGRLGIMKQIFKEG